MTNDEVVNGLFVLGFTRGFVVTGDEITFWENAEPQPSLKEIEAASKLYVKPELTVADKLASVGLSIDDLKSALGL
jgi:hypothetical protein